MRLGDGLGHAESLSLCKLLATGRVAFQRLLHHAQSLQYHFLYSVSDLIWQQIRYPHNSTLRRTLRENLNRCVVVSEWLAACGPSMSARLVVNGDDDLTNHHPICECDDSGAAFEFAVRYNLPIREVIAPPSGPQGVLREAYIGPGTMVNSGEFDGLDATVGCERNAAASRSTGHVTSRTTS